MKSDSWSFELLSNRFWTRILRACFDALSIIALHFAGERALARGLVWVNLILVYGMFTVGYEYRYILKYFSK